MLIFNKSVDQSVLKEGFSIPLVLQRSMYDALGFQLSHGQKKEITIMMDGREFKATVKNLDFDKKKYPTHTDILQIRYSPRSPLALYLQTVFTYTGTLIEHVQKETGSRRLTDVSADKKEYLSVYATPVPGVLNLESITNREFVEESRELCALGEQAAELVLNRCDEAAGIQVETRSCKIRKLNRAIGDELKKAYGYRCQICGQKIGEQYASNLIHAHHIRYFTESLDNSTKNLMIVCPNHHGIIHDTHAQFDFDHKTYTYPNGYVEGLKLNYHI